MPRKNKTVPRGIVLNQHKLRYWLSVGASPTSGALRVLHKFGGFFPKPPIPFGHSSVYEKPPKKIENDQLKNMWKKDSKIKYRQMLQAEMNLVER